MKILPGIIPMLVSEKLAKPQFQEIMSCVKQLLQQIELTKLATLPDATEAQLAAKASADPFGQEESKTGGA